MFLQHLASVLNMFVVIFLIFHFKFFQDSEQPIPFTAFRATANVRYNVHVYMIFYSYGKLFLRIYSIVQICPDHECFNLSTCICILQTFLL